MKKALTGARLWIAIASALAAGLSLWLTTPWPKATLNLNSSELIANDEIFSILAISSDARYIIARQTTSAKAATRAGVSESIAIWDRHAETPTPVIIEEKPRYNHAVFLSPNERLICYVDGPPEQHEELPTGQTELVTKPRAVRLFEVASGRKVKELQSSAKEFAFDVDGELRVIDNGRMCDIDTGAEVKRIPVAGNEFKYLRTLGQFAVYTSAATKVTRVQLYSWRTGELAAERQFSSPDLITQVSQDGRVLGWAGLSWLTVGVSDPAPEEIVDTVSGERRGIPRTNFFRTVVRLAPNGDHLAFMERVPERSKWLKWLPVSQPTLRMRVIRWRTEEELATFTYVRECLFSADSRHVAVVRDDNLIEIYDFPFRTPWAWIGGAIAGSGAAVWTLGWMLTSWRGSRKKIAPA